jgi:hypothetical protein
VRKFLRRLGFSCAPNARSVVQSQDLAVIVSHGVCSCHILSQASDARLSKLHPVWPPLAPTVDCDAMTVPARVKQADIARALREAQKIGAKRVKIGADGSIDILLETEEQAGALANGRHDEPLGPIRIRDRPKKKVVL